LELIDDADRIRIYKNKMNKRPITIHSIIHSIDHNDVDDEVYVDVPVVIRSERKTLGVVKVDVAMGAGKATGKR